MKPILVVVNAPESRRRLVEILVHAGHSVMETDSGERAIQLACHISPALILLAIVMPDLNGLEIEARVRSSLKSESPPIILLGTMPPIGMHDEPLNSLVSGYVNIDVPAENLLAAVSSQLS